MNAEEVFGIKIVISTSLQKNVAYITTDEQLVELINLEGEYKRRLSKLTHLQRLVLESVKPIDSPPS